MPKSRILPRLAAVSVAAVALAGLAACETTPGPYAYSPYEAGRVARVEYGTIVGVRPVQFGGSRDNTGALVGGAAGAAVGSQFGGDTGGHIAGALIGAIGGAVAGDAIQRGQTQQGFAYTIRRADDGRTIEVAQADAQPLPPGMRVQIVYGDRVRITPAPY